MAVVQQPSSKIIPAYSDFICAVDAPASAIAAAFYFRFVFRIKVYIGSSFELITFKVAPNNNNIGIVDVGQVVKDFVAIDKKNFDNAALSIHETPQFSKNRTNLIKVQIAYATEYTTSAISSVTTSGFYEFGDYRVFNGCQQFEDGLDFDATPYMLETNPTGNFLTGFDSTINRKVRASEYQTVAFFSGAFTGLTSQQVTRVRVKFYDSADVQLGTTQNIDNETATGGTSYYITNGITRGLFYFGVGTQNLIDSGITIPTGTAYYTVYTMFNTSSGGGSGTYTQTSKTYTFEIQAEDCKGYETIRLIWLNRVGGWDYYNFTKKSTKSVQVKREAYKKTYGDWQASSYGYNTWERGRATLNNKGIDYIEANTDFITEAEAAGLEELFTSPEVFISDGTNSYVPVTVAESGYTKQTTANDLLKQYVISVEKSHNIRLQTT